MKQLLLIISILGCFLSGNINGYSQNTFSDKLIITAEDSAIINHIFKKNRDKQNLPIGELIVEIGKSFLKVPYVSQTIETGAEEIMVINLRQFDCTTFAENCLAFARCIKSGKTTTNGFIEELMKIRYRNGEMDGYCSRLHYFSEWIDNNIQKNILQNHIDTSETRLPIRVNFMSTHPDSYPALYENPKLVPLITEIEETISEKEFHYLPKQDIQENEASLKEGDIVGITTNIPGLDIAHVGIVTFKKDRAYLLNASSTLKRVVISDKPLSDYLLPKKSFTGIMIARPAETN